MWSGARGSGPARCHPGRRASASDARSLPSRRSSSRLRSRSRGHAELAAVEIRDRETQLRDALARRVAMVAGIVHSFGQLLDRHGRRRDVGIAEREVDHVFAGSPELHLERVDLGEHIGGSTLMRRNSTNVNGTRGRAPIRAGFGPLPWPHARSESRSARCRWHLPPPRSRACPAAFREPKSTCPSTRSIARTAGARAVHRGLRRRARLEGALGAYLDTYVTTCGVPADN